MPTFRGKRVTHKGYSSSLGADLGGAMADAVKPLGYAYTKEEDVPTEDEHGLLSSDRFVQALGNSLEAKGYKRL